MARCFCGSSLPSRRDRVPNSAFTPSRGALSGASLTRPDLSGEAIRLGRLLVELLPGSETLGLLALLLLQESRRLARNAAVKNKAKDTGRKGLKLTGGGLGVMQIKNQAKKDPNAALVALEKALAEDPYNTQANELLHDIAVDQGMVDTAAFALETIFEGHPENKKVGHRLGDYFMSHGLANRAAAIFSAMAKRDPTDLAASQKLIAATAQDSMKKNLWSEQTSMKDLIKNKDEAQKLEMKSRTGMTRDQIHYRMEKFGLLQKG